MAAQIKFSKSNASKYFVLVICILLAFVVTLGLTLNLSNLSLLKSIKNIPAINRDFGRLDQSILKLYDAENNCRMYIINGDRKYYEQFNSDIKAISLTLDTIEMLNRNEKPNNPENFGYLIKQKKLRTSQFIRLKKLADSLITFSSELQGIITSSLPKERLFSSRQFKNIVQIDTLHAGVQPKTKKKFFGRIIDAINEKDEKGVDSSRKSLIKMTITADTTSIGKAYNKLQLAEINKYYQKLYKANQSLKIKERELLTLNHEIISSIAKNLTEYKILEEQYYASVNQVINLARTNDLRNMKYFSLSVMILATFLLVIILFIIYKLYRSENKLINATQVAQDFAAAKTRFLSNMSHEIRNPLNSIIGFSEQLSTSGIAETHRTQVQAINSSSQVLLGVVNDILDFSKLEIGKVTFAQTIFQPALVINEVCNSMRVQADQKSITLITNIQINEETYVSGDPLRLKQVIMNLISNSIKFTEKGSVTVNANIHVHDKIASLNMAIIDTGIGISQDDQLSIFEEFTQVYDSSANKSNKGTGLGLAICKKIIEAQGGKIGLSSKVNAGAVFTIEIPFQIAEELPAHQAAPPQLNASKESLKGLKVLVVDDNQLNILLATSILKKHGINCSTANDGMVAFDLYINNNFDILLTDIQMPNMGGIELTKKIRSLESGAQIPIVGLTANIMPEDKEKYIAAGMNAIVIKPFKEQDLLTVLMSTLPNQQ